MKLGSRGEWRARLSKWKEQEVAAEVAEQLDEYTHGEQVMPKIETKNASRNGKTDYELWQYEDEHLLLTPGQMIQIEVFLAADGGYQRPLNERRVQSIADDLKKRGKSTYPEVTIANIRGKLQCVDGQHRLIAHAQADVPCPAHIISMTQAEAIDRFCRDNATAKALTRFDLLRGSRTPVSKLARDLSKQYEAGIGQVSQVLYGMSQTVLQRGTTDSSLQYSDQQIRAAEIVLEVWTKDSKFVQLKDRGDPGYMARTARGSKATGKQKVILTFSSKVVAYVLGALAKDYLSNITKLRKDLRVIVAAEMWSTSNRLHTMISTSKRAELLAVLRSEILLPYYASQEQ